MEGNTIAVFFGWVVLYFGVESHYFFSIIVINFDSWSLLSKGAIFLRNDWMGLIRVMARRPNRDIRLLVREGPGRFSEFWIFSIFLDAHILFARTTIFSFKNSRRFILLRSISTLRQVDWTGNLDFDINLLRNNLTYGVVPKLGIRFDQGSFLNNIALLLCLKVGNLVNNLTHRLLRNCLIRQIVWDHIRKLGSPLVHLDPSEGFFGQHIQIFIRAIEKNIENGLFGILVQFVRMAIWNHWFVIFDGFNGMPLSSF